MGFEEQKTRIQNELEYQRTIDTEANIERWNNELVSRKEALDKAQQAVHKDGLVIEACKYELQELKEKVTRKKNTVSVFSDTVKQVRTPFITFLSPFLTIFCVH